MRLKTLTFLLCLAMALLLNGQLTNAQDLTKVLTPGGELTPEAQQALRQSRQFKTLTPEEIQRGKAELEKRESESRIEEQERIEKEKQQEEQAKKAEEISQQEKELRYIANKYKDRTLRDIDLLTNNFVADYLANKNLDRNFEQFNLRLLDAFDQYQEDVIRDIINRFQLKSAFYRDSVKRIREIFSENKKEPIAKIKEAAAKEAKVKMEETAATTAVKETEPVSRTTEKVFGDFTDMVVKEILDNFTLKWAVKDIFRLYEDELPYAKPVGELQVFGHDIFSRPPDSFAPPTNVPVTEDYVVGPGDEIRVLMWGRIDAEYSLVVSKDGTIQFPRIGSISVAGMTYKDMKQLLKKEAESITGVTISVTMGRLRSITVFVVGEVKMPGAYTVSAFDTVINALLISGGPSPLGSLRNVQLKRNGKIVTTIDFYAFLLEGDTSKDKRLQPGDVVFVPKAENLVAIAGNVKRPAIYELKGNLSLNALIELAGGLAPSAYKQRVQIERSYKHEKHLVLDVTYTGAQSEAGFDLQDGDIVKVFPIAPEKVDAVYVYGNVSRPGSYSYRPGMRVTDVIRDETELKSDTDLSYGLIKRYVEPDMHAEFIPFNLGKAIINRDSRSDVKLEPYDEIYIFNKWLFSYKPYARIRGEVRKPETYQLADNMRIKDLIIAAGGLNRDAYMGKSHLFRTDPETKNVSLLEFNLDNVLLDDPSSNLLLQDQDEVVIHSIREYKPREFVSIYGMVNNPGQYPLAVGMTVKDLIMAGGNLKQGAFKNEAELVRFKLVDGDLMKTEVLSFDVAKAVTGEAQQNLELKEYDRIFIKKIPNWLEQNRVSIDGQVKYPGNYYVRKNEKLSSLIERAGGFTKDAYLRGAVFTRERVRQVQRERLDDLISRMEQEISAETGVEATGAMSTEEVQAFRLSLEAKKALLQKLRQAKVTGRMVIQLAQLEVFRDSKFDLRLEDGDHLEIPHEPESVNVLGEVYNPTSFLYEKGKRANFYLSRAGGPTANAEAGEMYIIRADGSVLSKSQSGTSYSWDPETNRWTTGSFSSAEVYPGDSVLVPRKLVKIHWIKETKDITQIMFQIAVVVGVIVAI
ncbi:MAG: SLBB domain-containing protein [Deltaproteobacteria bacterium]